MTVSEEIRRAYDRVGDAWNDGPAAVYRALAQPVLEAAGDVAGATVLDVGTGSGVLADGLVRRGARVIGLDLALGMLRSGAEHRPPAVVADVRALPIRTGSVDIAAASFVLNHLAHPVAGLRELARVLRRGGRLLATTFEGEAPHPAKQRIDEVAQRFGYLAPDWYLAMKSHMLPLLATQPRFAEAAAEAGLAAARVDRVPVRLELSPAELVGWRLGMAHLAPFATSLPGSEREALVAAAEAAVADAAEPVEMVVLLLVAGS